MVSLNPFRWGSNKDNSKDYFSTSFFSSKPAATINEDQALSIPAVAAAVNLICNSIASLPVYLYQEHEMDGSIEKVAKDPRINLLNHSANKYDTAQTLKRALVQDLLLRGKAYIYKTNTGQLVLLPAKNVQEELYTEDYISVAKKTYTYHGMETKTLDESQVIVIDSGAPGILYSSGTLLNTALAQLDYQDSLMQNGAVPTGILRSASRLTETAINRLRESWASLYTGAKKTGKTVILEEGLDYQQLSMSPEDLQLHESNKQMIGEIARIFSIPESKLNAAAQKYASLEQDNLAFLTGCIRPIITAIESALDQQMLNPGEKSKGFYFRFSTEELLRVTEAEKIAAIDAAFKGGLISFNEARNKLDLPKVQRDYYSLNIGQVLKYEDGTLENLNTLVPNNKQEVTASNGKDGATEPGNSSNE